MIRNVFLAGTVAFVLSEFPAHADPLDALEGKWVSETTGSVGEPIVFAKAFDGYDVTLPWMPGLSAITRANGHKGAHIKVEGRTGAACYYYVAIVDQKEITWALRDGPESCLPSAVLKKDP